MNFPELFSNSVMDQRLHCMQCLFQINNAMVRCFPRLCNKYLCSRWSCFLCCMLGVLARFNPNLSRVLSTSCDRESAQNKTVSQLADQEKTGLQEQQ